MFKIVSTRIIRHSILVGSLMTTLQLLSMSAQAQIRPQELKLGFQSPRGNSIGEGADKFAELVASKSGGKMKVQVYPGGALGGDVQTISAARAGTVDAIQLSAGLLSTLVKEYSLLDLPFLFNNADEASAVIEGPFGRKMAELLESKGLIVLGSAGGGFRHLTNSKRPVTKLEDIKGMKIRVLQSSLFIDLWKSFGANAVPMPFPELYTALEQGAVDGQENPAPLIVAVKFNEVQKNLALTHHVYLTSLLVFSKPVWDKLNTDERAVLKDAASEAQKIWREGAKRDEVSAIAELRKSMQVTDIAPVELAKLRVASKPVIDKYSALAEPDVAKLLFSEVEKVRSKK